MEKQPRPTILLVNDAVLKKVVVKKPVAKVEVIKQGFLSKQGGARGGRKNWKRRFFVIKEDCLYYYTDHEQTTLLGVMPLLQSKLLDITSNVQPPPAFIDAKVCYDCKTKFTITTRVHHCRYCSHPYCDKCCSSTIPVIKYGFNNPVRVCKACYRLVANELEHAGVSYGNDDPIDDVNFSLPFTKKENLFALKNSEREFWVHGDSQQDSVDWIVTIKTIMDRAGQDGLGGPASGPPKKKKDDWEIPFSQIKVGELVGSGAFGDVYGGTLWGTEIAIKTLRTDQFDSKEKLIEELKKEVDILAQLRHPNVILYMGVCGLPNVCILTEWCKRGSLYDILHDHSIHINAKLMVDLAMGIAQGVNYLHSLERKIIHRDLKSHNVLVSANWQVKVADFGLSHIREQRTKKQHTQRDLKAVTVSSTAPPATHYGVFGTPEWMAPEVMEGEVYNEKIDVYSFGILLTEVVSRQMPFHDKYTIKSYHDVWDAVLDDGAMPTIPKWCESFFQDLIVSCLDRDPSRRPSFGQVISLLRHYAGLKDEEYLIKYDLPRIGEMMQSPEPTVQALAVSEIAELLATRNIVRGEDPPPDKHGDGNGDEDEEDPFDVGRRGRSGAASNPLYLEKEARGEPYRLSDQEAAHMVQRCAALLTSTSSQVQLSACRALANLLECDDKAKKQIDLEVVLTEGGAVHALLELLSSKTKVIVKEATRALLHVAKDLPVGSQLVFKGLPLDKLDKFKALLQADLLRERQRFEELARLIQKQDLFSKFLNNEAAQEAEWERANAHDVPVRKSTSIAKPRKKPSKKKFQFEADRQENEEQRELREAMEARARLDDDWLSLLASKPALPLKFRECYAGDSQYHGYLLCYHKGEKEWKLCFAVLHLHEVRVFEGIEDDPQDPHTTIKLHDVYGEPLQVKLGVAHAQPHCFRLVDVDYEMAFSAADDVVAAAWAAQILEKKAPVVAEEVNDAELEQLSQAASDEREYCRRCKATPGHPGSSCQEYTLQRQKTRDLHHQQTHAAVSRDSMATAEELNMAVSLGPPPAAPNGDAGAWAGPFVAHWKHVDHLGYLTKKKKTFNRWNQAFFVLVGTDLHYYPTHQSEPSAPHNTLYICSKQGKSFGRGVALSTKKEHCFSVEDPNRTWHLACQSEDELKTWVAKLNANVANAGLAALAAQAAQAAQATQATQAAQSVQHKDDDEAS